jgi:3D (Asp-Asp-Asp) domain-containing protein
VDFDIFPLGSTTAVAHWTIVPGHPISSVGGNRYGWFVIDEIPELAIDNTLRTGLCHSHAGNGEMNGKDSGKATFHSQAEACEGQNDQHGSVQESDTGSGTNFQSSSISAATFTADEDSQTLTMVGTGLDNGLPVAFTMVAVDNGTLGPGVFSLILSDGYAVTGALTSGSLAIQ